MEKKSRSMVCAFSNEIRQRQIIRGLGFAGIVSLLTTACLQQAGKLHLPNTFTTTAPIVSVSANTQNTTPALTSYVAHDAAAVSQVSRTPVAAPAVKKPVLPVHWSIEANSLSGGFYHAAHKAGLTSSEEAQLTKILGNKIDFRRLHAHDQFKVITERVPANPAQHIKLSDQIVAADFVVNNQHIQAIRYQSPNGTISYYQPDGSSLEPGFLRYPVHYTRIGSGFSPNRFDPVTHKYHPHLAIDFDAPMGTPIMATGDGRIDFMHYENGYGNVVKINHAGHIMSLYAHMRNFAKGLHNGSAVKKGQVIGYVGMTGYTTGPHTHYQLTIDGKPVNPLTAKLPSASGVPASQKSAFNQLVARLKGYWG